LTNNSLYASVRCVWLNAVLGLAAHTYFLALLHYCPNSFRICTYASACKQTTLSPFRINTCAKTGGGGASLPCPSGQSFSGGVRTHNRQKQRAGYGPLPGERREDGKARLLWIGNLYGNSTLQERSEHQKPGILRASIQGPSLSWLTWPWCRS